MQDDPRVISVFFPVAWVGSDGNSFVITPNKRDIKTALESCLDALSFSHTLQQLRERIIKEETETGCWLHLFRENHKYIHP